MAFISILLDFILIILDQGSAGSWCSRANFKVSKIFAGRSLNFSDIKKYFGFSFSHTRESFTFIVFIILNNF